MDVLGTRGDALLAAWFAGTARVCYDSLLQRAAGDELVALRACDAVQGLRHADGKRRGLDRISRLLHLWRLPARGTKVVRWPRKAVGRSPATEFAEVRARLTARGRRLWRWVRDRTRVVTPCAYTYASHWNHIRSSRCAEMRAFLATGAAARAPDAAGQASMTRVKRYWRLPVSVSPSQALRQGRGEIRDWAKKCFGMGFRAPAARVPDPVVRPAASDRTGPPGAWPEARTELEAYVLHLAPPRDGEVLVQEDKDKSAAWRMPAQLYLHWTAHLLVADPTHWRLVDCTVQEVSALYRHLHRGVLPPRFLYMASARRWADFRLNYMYMNLKAKCFGHRQGRTCEKPGHSCFRKVVSWCTHPAVDYYRWLARGVQTAVTAWGRGHDVASLKTAAAELREKVAELAGPPPCAGAGAARQADGLPACARCGTHMPCPAVVVADAAQMYEEVPPSRVREGLGSLVTWAKERGYTGVAVSKRTAGPSFLVRQRWRHPPGTVLSPGRSSMPAWTWPLRRVRSPWVTPSGVKQRGCL